MSLILGFDTSGPYCAAALLRDGEIVQTQVDEMKRGQAEHLMPMLTQLLEDADVSWQNLTAIGVGVGPGNFTGIRISVSTARGLALGLDIPAVGVSTFDTISFGRTAPHIAAVPAPRDQLYVFGQGYETPALLPAATPFTTELVLPQAPAQLVEKIALVAHRRHTDTPSRPAPLYVKPADAAPPRDPAPVILP